jgi:hypothetical protein
MNLGLFLGLSARQSVASPPPPFSSIAADGWQATVASPTDLSLTPFTVSRAGFNSSASATTIADTLYLTKRIREPYPDEATLTADQVAISDYVYADDVIAGAINNSTETSPKPIANWQMVERTTVGDSLYWEITAFHRDARNGTQVACVRVRANDGTTQTAWQTVSSTVVSAHVEDANPLEVYAGTLDISGLADPALIWLEAEVYPHFGVAASVLKSEDVFAGGTYNAMFFGRRYYRRDTSRAATPRYAYVASTGNDATGVYSTTAATAKASPFLTLGGAMLASIAQLGTTNGAFDDARIRIVDNVNSGAFTTGTYRQDIGAVIVERDPDVARSAAILTQNGGIRPRFTTHTTALTEGSIIFRDLTIVRTSGTLTFQGELASRLYAQFVNCDFNFASLTGNMRNNSDLGFYGCDFVNYANNITAAPGLFVRIIRGNSGDFNGNLLQTYNLCGNSFTESSLITALFPNEPGFTAYNNSFLAYAASNALLAPPAVFAVVQNLVERTGSTSFPSIALSADTATFSITHGVAHHNTVAGDDIYGRLNWLYDDTIGTPRFHKLFSAVGNIGPQLNTKSDIFMTDGTRQGNWAFNFGAGVDGTYTEGAVPAAFDQDFGGFGSVIAGGDVLFTNYQGVNATGPVAGAGGGTYTLQSGSPAKDIVTRRVLSYDITGAPRPTSGTIDAGAYA